MPPTPDPQQGIELDITIPQKVRAKTLKLHLKVTDRFSAALHDTNGAKLHRQDDGYVPAFMPGEHYGDYVILDIDIQTGQITNWKPPTSKQLQQWMTGDED